MKKISHKLIIGMVILLATTIGFIWLYQTVYLEKNYTDRIINTLKLNLRNAAEMYEKGSLEEFEKFTETLLISRNITTELYLVDGVTAIRGPGGMRGQMTGNRLLRGEYLVEVVSAGEAMAITTHPKQNIELIAYSILVEEGSAILTGTIPAEPINETVGILKDQLLTISSVLLVLSVIIGTIMGRMLLKPIRELNSTVNQLAAGNMDSRAKVTSADELGDLSKNFNRMADQLSKLDKLRKDLVANVSHELRTPLGLIRGYAEMAMDLQSDNKEKRQGSLEIIIEETDRLSLMVDDILNLSQIQAGYAELKLEKADLVQIAQTSLNKYRVAAESKGLRLSIDSDKEEHIAVLDEKRMHQVLGNLLGNAINHTDPGGEIKVVLMASENRNRVEVIDTGKGIPEEEIAFIWDRYYKVDKSGSGIKGTGIGLAIVKGILEAHDYKYGVESELDKGTKFWFEY
jgi:signal transduction histidine kinase